MVLRSTPQYEKPFKALDFFLKDYSFSKGKQTFTLREVQGDEGLIVAFICNHCPYVKAIIEDMVDDFHYLQSKGFGVVAIMPNDTSQYPEDSPEKMYHFAQKYSFNFPYLWDETQKVAQAYGAICTPDFFGFNQDLKLCYRGRLNDARVGDGDKTPQQSELKDFFLQNLFHTDNEKNGLVVGNPSMGCSIKWATKLGKT